MPSCSAAWATCCRGATSLFVAQRRRRSPRTMWTSRTATTSTGSDLSPALDLTGMPVVDNHCHAVAADQALTDVSDWRSRYTQSPHAPMCSFDAADTAFYRRLLHAKARSHCVLDDEDAEVAVLAARRRFSAAELTGPLFSEARIGCCAATPTASGCSSRSRLGWRRAGPGTTRWRTPTPVSSVTWPTGSPTPA